MNIIVAVDKNWAIGKDNKLLVSIPADMKFFRETTKGNIVVMKLKELLNRDSKMEIKKINLKKNSIGKILILMSPLNNIL